MAPDPKPVPAAAAPLRSCRNCIHAEALVHPFATGYRREVYDCAMGQWPNCINISGFFQNAGLWKKRAEHCPHFTPMPPPLPRPAEKVLRKNSDRIAPPHKV